MTPIDTHEHHENCQHDHPHGSGHASASMQAELDKLKACIHCGMCLPVCPTYLATGSEAESPRGRLYLMKKWIDGELDGPTQLTPHLDQCLGCQACQTACPSGVQYGDLLFDVRKALLPQKSPSNRWLKRFVFKQILPNAKLLNFGRSALQFYQKSGMKHLLRGLGFFKLFPGLAQCEQLLPTLGKRSRLFPGMSFGDMNHERVVLLTGCVMDIFYNPVHWATIEVLVANHYYVSIPEQTCCGALAFHGGETDIAKELAIQNIDSVLKRNPDWIVLNSAGCGAAMKEYPHLLAGVPVYQDKSKVFADKVVDVLELLDKKPLEKISRPVDQTVTYHAACHLHHAQGIQEAPFRILSQIPGLKLIPLKSFDACCGSAGIYNVEHPELSEEILATKIENLMATNAETVMTGNPGCLMQIESGLKKEKYPMKVKHPIEVLAEAYRNGDAPLYSRMNN